MHTSTQTNNNNTMNFFLPSFFDYLQNQPSLNIVQQQLEYADVETASITTMLLTILLLLSTVEGVILVFTTLYSWCLFPIHLYDDVPGRENDEIGRQQLDRRQRRRRIGSHGGEHHLLWWLDVEYDSDSDDYDDDDDESWSEDLDYRNDQSPVHHRLKDDERLNRCDRIQMSLQEHIFHTTQFDDCCAICLVEFQSNDRVVSGTQPCCRSCFHRSCLEAWLKIQSSCPCCRMKLLLKTRELLARQRNRHVADRSYDHSAEDTATFTVPTSERILLGNEQPSARSDVFGTYLINRGALSNDMPDWSPEICPEISASGSREQFWCLIF
jgi:hypothetical protein